MGRNVIVLVGNVEHSIYPRELKDLIKDRSFKDIRTVIIPKFIQYVKCVGRDNIDKAIKNLKVEEYVRFQSCLYIKNKEGIVSSYCIEKINRARPWTLDVEDGSEYIVYLDWKALSLLCIYIQIVVLILKQPINILQ